MGRLDNRVALVTGAGGASERASPEPLPVKVPSSLCADMIDADETVTSLPGGGGSAMVLDVTRPDDVENAVAQIIAEQGRLDILANNAGGAQPIGTLLEPSRFPKIAREDHPLSADNTIRAPVSVDA